MVLHPPGCGRVGHRRTLFRKGPEIPDHTTGLEFPGLSASRYLCLGIPSASSGHLHSGRSIGPPGRRPPSDREAVLVTAMVVTIVSSDCSVWRATGTTRLRIRTRSSAHVACCPDGARRLPAVREWNVRGDGRRVERERRCRARSAGSRSEIRGNRVSGRSGRNGPDPRRSRHGEPDRSQTVRRPADPASLDPSATGR